MNADLTMERLRCLLHYDKETGIFTHRVSRGNVRAGSVAGYPSTDGYRCMMVDGRKYRAHRLAWLYVYGGWPENQIDHRNGIRTDNRIANLREATNAENCLNRGVRSNNTSGFKGVSFDAETGKWRAGACVNGARIAIGRFESPEAASRAYQEYASKHHGEFKYHGCFPLSMEASE